jgi:hypothetical protein
VGAACEYRAALWKGSAPGEEAGRAFGGGTGPGQGRTAVGCGGVGPPLRCGGGRHAARHVGGGRREAVGSRPAEVVSRTRPSALFVAHCGAASQLPVTHLASDRQRAPPDACSLRSATTLPWSLAPSSARGSRRSARRDMAPACSCLPAFRRRALGDDVACHLGDPPGSPVNGRCASASHTPPRNVVRGPQTRPQQGRQGTMAAADDGEEELPVCRARAFGTSNAAGVASLTQTAVVWRPDDPAAATDRRLLVHHLTGTLRSCFHFRDSHPPRACVLCVPLTRVSASPLQVRRATSGARRGRRSPACGWCLR